MNRELRLNDHRLDKIAIVVSHPVQYQTPLFDAIAQRVQTDVYYAMPDRALGNWSPGQAQERWDVVSQGRYGGFYLQNIARKPSVNSFLGCNTPGVGVHLRKHAYQACIIYGWYLKTHWQALIACRRAGIPTLAISDSHQHYEQSKSGLSDKVRIVGRRAALHLFDGFAVPGQWAFDYLVREGVDQDVIYRVPHSIDVGRFAKTIQWTDQQRILRKRRLGINDNAFVVMTCAKLVKGKRISDLFKSVSTLPFRIKQAIHLLVVGDGPEHQELENLASDLNIIATFTGFINQRQLPHMYAIADCFVLCSESETWGIVVNEALASGVPVIASSHVGAGADLIHRRVNGHTYPVGNIAALAQCLVAVSQSLNVSSDDKQQLRKRILDSIKHSEPSLVALTLHQVLNNIACKPNRYTVNDVAA